MASAEAAVRGLLSMVNSSKSSSVEFLHSQIEVERVALFSGDNGLSHALRYTKAVCGNEGLGDAVVTVMDPREAAHASFIGRQVGNRIEFSPLCDAIDQLDVLHEVAHLVNHRESRSGHGSSFIAVYVDLVRRYVGESVAFILGYELHTAAAKTTNGFS